MRPGGAFRIAAIAILGLTVAAIIRASSKAANHALQDLTDEDWLGFDSRTDDPLRPSIHNGGNTL